jgi:hypothetical protein
MILEAPKQPAGFPKMSKTAELEQYISNLLKFINENGSQKENDLARKKIDVSIYELEKRGKIRFNKLIIIQNARIFWLTIAIIILTIIITVFCVLAIWFNP